MKEISPENQALLDKRYTSTMIIVFAQIATTVALTVVAWISLPKIDLPIPQESVSTLWVAVLFIAIGSFLLRRLFVGWDRLKNVTLLSGVKGLLVKLQTNTIILGALAEMVAIIGFVISIVTGSAADMFRAAAIALVVFLVNFPRKAVWRTIVASLEDI